MFSSRTLPRSRRCLVTLLATSLLAPMSAQAPAQTGNSDAEARRFADNLLKQMTLAEKIGQMSQVAYKDEVPDAGQSAEGSPLQFTPASKELDERIARGEVGSLLFITDPVKIARLQHIAIDRTRLHIPLIIGFDVIHGFRTIYPVPIAMAASWDPAAAETAQRMAAREASSVGIRWTFAPMVDIARDPRWGRMMEGAGEDPYLGSRMAEAQVRGFQSLELNRPDSLLACVKHFAGYGAALGGRDYDTANISDDQLWNVYLPPFKAAVDAGAGSLMTAYMDLNGVPASANAFLLHDVLRDRWKFKGFTVSDWESVKSLTVHGFTANDREAAIRGTNAGVEMEMTSHTYRDELPKAVAAGEVKQATIDDAVRDILVAKYKLGLFKQAVPDPAAAAKALVTPEQRAASRLAAGRTAVLLRNEGHLLPFTTAPKSLAVIGPLADAPADTMGSWSLAGHPSDTVTVVEGLRRRFAPQGTEIRSAKGVEIERVQPSIFDPQFPSPKPTLTTDDARKAEFERAIALVRSSDASVLVLGEAQTMSGERASRLSLDLPGRQLELLQAAVATGKPVALVLMNARPLDLTWASEHVPAILEVWYPGTEGGNAVADLLAGTVNPGGKLPFTWPRNVGQIPLFYGDNLTQIPEDPETRYWDGSSAPLYPFGYGLSYSQFAVDQLALSAPELRQGGSLNVTVKVTNRSATPGDEVVQLYVHQRSGSASRPVRELKGFRRVHLGPNATETVTLPLTADQLRFWSAARHEFVADASTFDLWVGNSSEAPLHATFVTRP